MARYLGTAAGRTEGAAIGKAGFTRAKVFTTPGQTTFDIPSDAQKVKVFVIGSGSNYTAGCYCHYSSNCDSGVCTPRCCYCLGFCGHLTGAGGGYSEKTYTQDADQIAGKTMAIQVGCYSGTTTNAASCACIDGKTAVTATAGQNTTYTWSCTSNSTARDNSNDNPIAFDFSLPRCGYANYINADYNFGGTGSGGDINRCGGRGMMTPMFRQDSYIDVISCYASGSGGGGSTVNTYGCWINPNFYCSCLYGYHTVFGSNCGVSSWRYGTCGCYILCNCTRNLCIRTGGSSGACHQAYDRYYFAGSCGIKRCCSVAAAISDNTFNCCDSTNKYNAEGADEDPHVFIQEEPVGMGGQSGSSSDNGLNGQTEQMTVHTCMYRTCGYTGGGGSCNCHEMNYVSYAHGYDYSFGGTQYSCYCMRYWPGCISTCTSKKGNSAGTQTNTWCYRCIGYTWVYTFGSVGSGTAHCFCLPYGLVDAPSTSIYCDCRVKCINVGFRQGTSACVNNNNIIPLSTLVSDTDTNVADVEYGQGATLSQAAGPGGGGNRRYCCGGNGLVVVVY